MSSYTPHWTPSFEGYMMRFLGENHRKVSSVLEWEDLVQEGYCCFYRVLNEYKRIENPRHLMGLFKKSLDNMITDNVRKAYTKRRQKAVRIDQDNEGAIYSIAGESENAGRFLALIDDAPEDVTAVISLYLSGGVPSGVSKGSMERRNEYLCRVLGYDSRYVDLFDNVRNYFLKEY